MSEESARRVPKLLLGRRMTLVVAGIAILLAMSYLVAGLLFARVQLEDEFKEDAQMTAASLASSLVESILTHNLYNLPDLLENAQLANPNLVYAFVCDAEGNPVAFTHSFKYGVPGDLQKLAAASSRNRKAERSLVLRTERGDIFHFIYPLQGNPGGFLHLGFSMAKLDSKLEGTARRLVGFMLLGLLLSAMAGGLVYRGMSRPITDLINAVANLGAGDLKSRVKLNAQGDDEVSLLALAFNNMADQLQEKLTELERSRSDLADEKTRIQAILDGMLHGVIFYNPDGSVGYWNKAAREHWGWNAEGVPEAVEAIQRVQSGRETSHELRVRRGDRTMDLIISSIRREDGELLGVVEITSDVTEQVNSARALAHAEKLNVVGQLAAGVAHEVNSPLDGALEAARILEKAELPFEQVRNFAHLQRTALERIAAIVYRLLTFSRRAQAAKRKLPLWPVIFEAAELIKYRLNKHKLRLELPEAGAVPHIIEGEALELSQVIVNLLSNSVDASPEERTIKIEVSDSPGWLEISVADQGKGIPKETQARIFMPFFTTKEVGKGTGLGLAVSKNIVEQYGGKISHQNLEPPWGACFTVHLPWDGSQLGGEELEAQKSRELHALPAEYEI